jgi:hypothetical protein
MSDKLTRHQVLLFEGDWDRLNRIYTNKSATSVIRDLVRSHCDRVESELARKRGLPEVRRSFL